jgi:hypothetical protein
MLYLYFMLFGIIFSLHVISGVPFPTQIILLDSIASEIFRGYPTMMILMVQFSQALCFSLCLSPKYFHSQPVFRHSHFVFFF